MNNPYEQNPLSQNQEEGTLPTTPTNAEQAEPTVPVEPTVPAEPTAPMAPTVPAEPAAPGGSYPPQWGTRAPIYYNYNAAPQNPMGQQNQPVPPTGNSPYPPVWQPFTPNVSANTATPQPVDAPKKKSKGLRILAGILAGVMILIAGISGGYFIANQENTAQNSSSNQSPLPPAAGSDSSGETSQFDISTGDKGDVIYSYEQIVQQVSPSIVNITVYSADGSAGSYASGIIMDAQKGYVLTNDHIYGEIPGAKFLITLNNKTEFKATFVSGDSRSDIAILKIENPKNLVAATFSTTPVTVGERVLAIGQSYGYADTVSEGIVSAANRRVNLSEGGYSEQYIQTTAAINPGNSGGALVNMAGQVVGVTSAKIASQEVEGLGFAIPSKKALSIVKNLQENGTVKGRAKLGITYTEMNTVAAEVNDCPVGLYVQSVDETADVAKKGMKKGDVITHVDGKEITVSTVLLDIIEEATAGDTLTLTVYSTSSKSSKKLTVTLGEAESTNSYKTASQAQDKTGGNDLPENPFDFYFGE